MEVASKYSTVETLRQQYMFVPAKHKDCYLAFVLTGAWARAACTQQSRRRTTTPGRRVALREDAARWAPLAGQAPGTGAISSSTFQQWRLSLCPLLAPCLTAAELAGSTSIIFTRTCDSTRKLALMLRNLGFGAVPIHGQMSQPKRLAALNKFKVGQGRRTGQGRLPTGMPVHAAPVSSCDRTGAGARALATPCAQQSVLQLAAVGTVRPG